MSCSPFDLRDYVLDELGAKERLATEQHLKSCAGCREELGKLDLTRAALLTVPDEEIPQRIAFVSDQVFEPSPLRRWFGALWGSAARLGFASAAMLSIALVSSALIMRPAPAPGHQAAVVDTAKLEAQFTARMNEAVTRAVAATEARQAQRMQEVLADAEHRHTMELKSIQLAVDENLSVMQKRLSRYYLASNDLGARP